MPRKNMIYDVFVSSPGDVVDEKEIIKEVIDEINSIHSRSDGNSLNYIDFNNSTYPDKGEYSQDVVNNQIGEYDIIIAIFKNRLGSPTPCYESGTVEEIEKAMILSDSGKYVKIAVYFLNESIADDEENVRLESFKSRIMNSDSKLLCGSYSEDNFRTVIRNDLEKMFRDSVSYYENSILFKNDIDSKMELIDIINRIIKGFNSSLNIVNDMNNFIFTFCNDINDDISVDNLNYFNDKLNFYNIELMDKCFNNIRSFFNILVNKDFVLDKNNKDFREIFSILYQLSKVVDSIFNNFKLFENKINSIDLNTESNFAKEQCIATIKEVSKNLNKCNNPFLSYLLFIMDEFDGSERYY